MSKNSLVNRVSRIHNNIKARDITTNYELLADFIAEVSTPLSESASAEIQQINLFVSMFCKPFEKVNSDS